MAKLWGNEWIYHVLAWLIFISYEMLVSFSFTNHLSSFGSYFWAYVINIMLFYTNSNLIFACTLSEKKKDYVLLIALIICEIIFFTFLKYIIAKINVALGFVEGHQIGSVKLFIMESLWRAVYFIGLSTGYWLFTSTVRQLKMINVLEKLQLEGILEQQRLNENLILTENAKLKSQINPHFLFNVLNFIYNSALKKSDRAPQAILLLSEMMRFALSPTEADNKVELQEEVQHIENFITLNQLRARNELAIEYRLSGRIDKLRIIPLLLITIIENVIKHGDLTDKTTPALIDLSIQEKILFLQIRNKKKEKHQNGYGIGLQNTIERLDRYYPDNYRFVINQTELEYEFQLTINL